MILESKCKCGNEFNFGENFCPKCGRKRQIIQEIPQLPPKSTASVMFATKENKDLVREISELKWRMDQTIDYLNERDV